MKTTSATRLRKPSKKAAPVSLLRRILFGQFRFKRKEGAMRITWGDTLMAPAKAAGKEQAGPASTPASSDERTLVLSELGILLSANPKNRQALRHLVFFESAFSKKGYACLEDLPLTPLRKAHDQLQLLASSWSSRVLETLATRMAATLIRRGGDTDSVLSAKLAAAAVPVVVNEGRLSDFFMLADERFPELGNAAS